jgi:hypothetical protein
MNEFSVWPSDETAWLELLSDEDLEAIEQEPQE